MSPSRRPGNMRVVPRRRNSGASRKVRWAKHRAGCAALPRTVPRAGSPRWQAAACKTLSVCYLPSRVMATGRTMPSRAPRWRAATGNGAAARWGHRALPPSRTRGSHGNGARAVRTATGHERCARQRGTGVEHRNGAREVRTAGAQDAKPRTAVARAHGQWRGGRTL